MSRGSAATREWRVAAEINDLRILLQNPETGLYLNSSGHWTEKIEEANSFSTGDQAMAAALEHELVNLNLVYAFPDSSLNFSVPVQFGRP